MLADCEGSFGVSIDIGNRIGRHHDLITLCMHVLANRMISVLFRLDFDLQCFLATSCYRLFLFNRVTHCSIKIESSVSNFDRSILEEIEIKCLAQATR